METTMDDHDRTNRLTADPSRWEGLKPLARAMRHQSTEAEALLWERLRGRRCVGLKFRRQHAISGFIVDFVCLERRLIVEVDGSIHAQEDQHQYDEQRTGKLFEAGFTVLRVTNDQVMNDIDEVVAEIVRVCEGLNPQPPSPGGEGGLVSSP